MNAIHRILRNGVAIERVELLRATFNEAQEINHNLLDDISDYNKIIVDLSACDYIDSSFLGAMVSAYRKIKEKGGSIVLIIGDTFLSKSYIYRDITSIFKVYHSLKEATNLVQKPGHKEINDMYNILYKTEEPAKIVQAQLILNPE